MTNHIINNKTFISKLIFTGLSISVLSCPNIHAQSQSSHQSVYQNSVIDLIKTLNEEKIKEYIAFHPVQKTIEFKQQQFKTKIKEQQGNFDPKIYSQLMDKNDSSFLPDYQAGISQQLENGVNWKGVYKNDSSLSTSYSNTLQQTIATVKDTSSTFLEVTIPLLRGFGANTALLQKITAQMNEIIGTFEQKQVSLLLRQQALDAFYEWQSQLMLVLVEYQSCEATRIRLQAITERAKSGDIPLIDITETQQELKKREKDLNKAFTNYEKSRLSLQNFLWNQYGLPLFDVFANTISQQVKQVKQEKESNNNFFPSFNLQDNNIINQLIAWKKEYLLTLHDQPFDINNVVNIQSFKALEQHPENQIIVKTLDLLKQSIEQLESLERPNLNLRLQPKYQWQKQQMDYEVGLDFSYPIFNRSNEAKTEYSKLEQSIFQIKLKEKQQKLQLNLEKIKISLAQIKERFDIALNEQQLAQTMLEAEQTKFLLGDSTIFLLNRREREIFDVYRQLVSIWLEYKQAQNDLSYLLEFQ